MLNDYNLIEKSRNVVTMECLNEMTEDELKILDIYLSKINPRDKSTRYVEYTLTDLKQLFGISQLRVERFERCIDDLQSKKIRIEIPNMGYDSYVLFPTAKFRRFSRSDKDKVGEYKFILNINSDLDDIFFNIENLGYIKYRLRNIINLKTKYDIKIYLFLKSLELKTERKFSITVDDFKKKISCNKPSYGEYKIFSYKVLKPSIERINRYTDLEIELFKARKKSGQPEVLNFKIKSKKLIEIPKEELEPKKAAELIQAQQPEQKEYDNPYNLPPDVMADTNFDINSLVEKIKNFITDADEQMIKDIFNVATFDYNPKKVNTTPILYYSGIVSNKTKELKEKLKMTAEEEAKSKKPIIKKTSLHNFKERDTDYDAIYAELNRQKYGKN